MKQIYLLIAFVIISSSTLLGQVAINTDGSVSDNSVLLDVKSTIKGVLLPRMTYLQRNAIPNPVEGLMVFCTNGGADGTGVFSLYQGGKWKNFPVNCPSPNLPSPGTSIPSPNQIIWVWNPVPIALGYKWNTSDDYSTATDMGLNTSKTETGLACNTTYLRFAWAYNACGASTAVMLTSVTTLNTPGAPTAGTHVASPTQIVWNWNVVSGATGYKWNTVNSYATATDMGAITTKTETGLTPNTLYTRYVWAYNTCTNSASTTLTQTTLPWVCGVPVTINHVAGAVAPVTKTVTYGTVTNIPGETTKCWITSNLGADHQATAVSDATEPSAGWYWQFNRKQGYKHDGTTRTPNTAWNSSINEAVGWLAANDPCTIELGTGWRIPTSTELTNVDAGGSWTNWNGPWNSGLKMHAAGELNWLDGVLAERGLTGYYWSSTMVDAIKGWFLYFDSGYSSMYGNAVKSYGYSLRCIKN